MPTPPSFITSYSPGSDWTTVTSPKTQTVLADKGDLLVVLAGTEDASTIIGTPSDGANTYSLLQSVTTASYCAAYAWAATVGGTAPLAITTASLPDATDAVAYSATLTASGGSGYSWSISAGSLPPWASLSASGVISGTPSGTSVVSFTVRVTDSAGDTATRGLTLTTAASGTAQPNGPGGTWTLAFEDTFGGTSLNTSNWTALNGANINNATMDPSKVSVSGGYCRLALPSTINSNPANDSYGSGSAGPTLAVGNCIEASINFPGPSGDTAYNWPAFWVAGNNWPAAGEEDIFESYNGTPSACNYHSPSGANNGPFPSGNWCNSFHTYTLVRGSGTNGIKCYWDGTLVRQVTPNDNGGAQSIMITMGSGNTYSATAEVLVDYVRMWT